MKYLSLPVMLFLFISNGCDKNEPPTCSITFPANGDEIKKGNTISIFANAKDMDGTITEVSFTVDGAIIGSKNTDPYYTTWNTNDVSTGNHIIMATAIDNSGSSTSGEISIFVVPTCNISSPANNAVFIQGETVTISVEVNVTIGSSTEIYFSIDGSEVGSSNSFPYNFEWNTTDDVLGTHTIKATAIENNLNSASDEISISLIWPGPAADFTASRTNISKQEKVQFTDHSTQDPASWAWDFGDGSTGTSQNPSHTYIKAGVYTVSLKATNTYGSDTAIKKNYITVNEVSDFDGNVYKKVKIGNQTWLAENLKTTHYRDGEAIPNHIPDNEWSYWGAGYCNYDHDPAYANTYGRLYNLSAVETGKLCPTGWHVASYTEWTTLLKYCGGYTVAAIKLKESGTAHWKSPNSATNETGFTALPGGERIWSGSFSDIGNMGFWWSPATGGSEWNSVNMRGEYSYVGSSGDFSGKSGYSVRCIQ